MAPDLGSVVARNVRAERGRRGWRQEDLAEKLGWDRSSVGHLETGRRKITVGDLPMLCRVFGIELDVLFFGADAADRRAMGMPRS